MRSGQHASSRRSYAGLGLLFSLLGLLSLPAPAQWLPWGPGPVQTWAAPFSTPPLSTHPLLGGLLLPGMQLTPQLLSHQHLQYMTNPYLGGPAAGNPYLQQIPRPFPSPGLAPLPPSGPAPSWPMATPPGQPTHPYQPVWTPPSNTPAQPLPFDPAAWFAPFARPPGR